MSLGSIHSKIEITFLTTKSNIPLTTSINNSIITSNQNSIQKQKDDSILYYRYPKIYNNKWYGKII